MTPVCRTCATTIVRPPQVQCVACVDETRRAYRAICKVTTRYDFAEPVEAADLEHVRGELAAALPAGHLVEFAYRPPDVVAVVARPDRTIYYRRDFRVVTK